MVPGTSLGPVRLGATERQVRHLLGRPESRRGRSRWWAASSWRVDLDADGLVEFVELFYDVELGWRAVYDGHDLLAVPADDVLEILQREQPRYDEDGYSVVCATGLALWRPVEPEEGDGGSEDEYRGGRCWSSVAIAAADYFDPSGTVAPGPDQA